MRSPTQSRPGSKPRYRIHGEGDWNRRNNPSPARRRNLWSRKWGLVVRFERIEVDTNFTKDSVVLLGMEDRDVTQTSFPTAVGFTRWFILAIRRGYCVFPIIFIATGSNLKVFGPQGCYLYCKDKVGCHIPRGSEEITRERRIWHRVPFSELREYSALQQEKQEIHLHTVTRDCRGGGEVW